MKRIFLLLLLSAVAVLAQGCKKSQTKQHQAQTVAFVNGSLETVETAGLDALFTASLKVHDELELTIIHKAKDEMMAEIISRDAEGNIVWIRLESEAKGMTELSIRIGKSGGDETKSRLIYEAIKKGL